MKTALYFILSVSCLLFGSCKPSEPQTLADLPRVDAALSMHYAERSVAFGERHSGSARIAEYAQWIRDTAAQNKKFQVSVQTFSEQTPQGKITFRNITAEIPGKSSDFVIVGAHYDTKQFLTFSGFQGANDGASGVAAALSMIRALEQWNEKPPVGIRFIFFDGEEAFVSYSANDGLHGSRHAAALLKDSGELKQCRGMILMDMIGDKELDLTLSADTSPDLLKKLDRICARMFPDLKKKRLDYEILDDHVPFQKIGIPAIDLIDFNYGPSHSYWHTDWDTLDKISGKSMKTVAELVFALIWSL